MTWHLPSPVKLKCTRLGFSTFEILIVVLILGILLAVGVPRIRHSLNQQQLQSTAARFVHDLEYASTLARTQNQSITVTFRNYLATNGNEYELVDQVYPRKNTPYIVQLRSLRSSNIDLIESPDHLTFDIYGYPDKSTTWKFRNLAGTISLTIDAQTGEIARL